MTRRRATSGQCSAPTLRFAAESLSCLPHAKRDIQCVKQCGAAKWLEQALYRALRQQTRSESLVAAGRDEDGRNVLPPACKFAPQLGARHARHDYVENQTASVIDRPGREKRICGRERLDGKAELPHEVGKGVANRLVIVDDGHEWTRHH